MRKLRSAPTYCSACHGQYPNREYIDFEAYYDGPVISQEVNGDATLGVKMSIDDLVLCENCLAAAAKLIGYVPNKKLRKENFELGRAVEEKHEKILKLEKIISDLEHTLDETLSGNVRRPSGRPILRLPDGAEKVA